MREQRLDCLSEIQRKMSKRLKKRLKNVHQDIEIVDQMTIHSNFEYIINTIK